MPYIKYTDDQKRRAAAVDLEEFLLRRGEKLIRSGPEKRLTRDHSVTVQGNEWYDHATHEGGGPVTFVQRFYDLSYPEAMTMLLDGEQGEACSSVKERTPAPPKPFELPQANRDMRRVYAYLLKQRYIDREVLSHFAREGTLYEDAQYHNAVFAGKDEHGVFRHAHKRSTNSYGKTFRVNVEGSAPQYSFHHKGSDDQLYVFEAPIDMLSYISLHPEGWKEHSYVSLCGTSDSAMLWMLKQDPALRDVALCLDHDEAGIEAALKHRETLRAMGYTDARIIQPRNKDWNENLKALHGLDAQPGEEHPQLVAAGPICARIVEQSANLDGTQASERIPLLLTQYGVHLHWGRFDQAIECVENAAALAVSIAVGEMKQLGHEGTPEKWAEFLRQRILPHQNRSSLKGREKELTSNFKILRAKYSGDGSDAVRVEAARAWLDFAASCAMVPVRYEAEQIKQQQKQEQGQAQSSVGLAMG